MVIGRRSLSRLMMASVPELHSRAFPRFAQPSLNGVAALLVVTPVKSLTGVSSPKFLDVFVGGITMHTNFSLAAAVLLMKRSTAIKLGQPILAKYVASTIAGLAPRIMGIGPTIAIPKLLAQTGITIADIDVVEINEAFASMAVYCRDNLGLTAEKMNPRGGAIALGHPLGATGARQIVTGLSELRRQKKKMLLTSMCVGTGMGMAGLFVNEQL